MSKNNAGSRGSLKIAAIAVALTLLTGLAIAQGGTVGSDTPDSITGWLLRFVNVIVKFITDFLMTFVGAMLDILEDSLLKNPEIYSSSGGIAGSLGNIMKEFLKILIPIYIVAITIAAIYLLFLTYSPKGRAQAKGILERLLVSMVLVSASPAIYQMLLFISEKLTVAILLVIKLQIARVEEGTIGDVMMEVFDNVPLASRITFILLFYYVMWSIFIAILTMWFRYLAVSLFALLFPFTLFLYFFDWTRTMGRKLLRNTLVWAFAPVIGAVWLAVGVAMMQSAAVGASSITGPLMAPLFMMVCMLMIAIAPLVMSEVMKWLGGIISSVGMLVPGPYGIVMVGAGGIMQGQSPAALMAMGLKAGVGSIFKGMRMGAGKAGMPSLAGAGGEAKTPTRADRKKDWKRDRRALDKAREKGRISDKGYRGAKGRIDQKYGMTPGGRFLRQMGTPGGVLGTMGMAGKGAASTLGSKLGKTRAGKALSSSKIGRGAARIGSGAARLRGRAGKWGRDKAKALAGTGPARWAAEKGRWAGRSAAKLAFNPVGAARDLGRQARAKATGQTLPKREAAGRGRELADEKKFRETRLKGQMAYGGRRSRPEDTMEQRMDLM